jgi:hypothetical protein
MSDISWIFPRPCVVQADHAQVLQVVQCLEEALKQEGSEMHEADNNEALARQRCEALTQELSTLEEDLSKPSIAEEEHRLLLDEVGPTLSGVCCDSCGLMHSRPVALLFTATDEHRGKG